MKLDQIGFYTLTDERASQASDASPMWRGEILLTDRCNYRCVYCQGLPVKNDIPSELAIQVIDIWVADKLKNIRFSGGEPTLYEGLLTLVDRSYRNGVERIAISTNGTASLNYYKELIDAGLNDICISLDAILPSLASKMAGIVNPQWKKVIRNIRELSQLTYVTVSIVFTSENAHDAKEIIRFCSNLGVADIRIVTASHLQSEIVEAISGIDQEVLDVYPILKYRVQNYLKGWNARGIREGDTHRCHLVKDDCVIAGKWHYPCGVYLRERGLPIGAISPKMRDERIAWFHNHDTHGDPICRQYCSDIYVEYNNRCEMIEKAKAELSLLLPLSVSQ
jgi:MoaA/NifB/PqqE/SkfB family radical SAM enzyme